jgi:hypothetical protein
VGAEGGLLHNRSGTSLRGLRSSRPAPQERLPGYRTWPRTVVDEDLVRTPNFAPDGPRRPGNGRSHSGPRKSPSSHRPAVRNRSYLQQPKRALLYPLPRRPEPVSEIKVPQPPLSEGYETVRPWDICLATPASPPLTSNPSSRSTPSSAPAATDVRHSTEGRVHPPLLCLSKAAVTEPNRPSAVHVQRGALHQARTVIFALLGDGGPGNFTRS